MDPVTLTLVGTAVHVAGRIAVAHAETRRVRARVELARVVADLSPGMEITGTGRGGNWSIRVLAAPTVVSIACPPTGHPTTAGASA
jgi:hypothetical protein